MAAIEYRGLNAVTNFDLSRYMKWLRPNTQEEEEDTHNDHLHSQPNPININIDININKPESNSGDDMSGDGGGSSPALGILLESSSKLKEMLEIGGEHDNYNGGGSRESKPERPRTFPEDIQTYFDCEESGGYVDTDDIIFGDLTSIAAPIFHCETLML